MLAYGGPSPYDDLPWWQVLDAWQLVGWALLVLAAAVYVGGVIAVWFDLAESLVAVYRVRKHKRAAGQGPGHNGWPSIRPVVIPARILFAVVWPLALGAKAVSYAGDRES